MICLIPPDNSDGYLSLKSYKPYFLIITDDYQSLRNIEIIKDVLSQKINLGFSMLIVQERLLGLPNECTTFINVEANDSIIFENELTSDKQQVFKADFNVPKELTNVSIDFTASFICNSTLLSKFSTL